MQITGLFRNTQPLIPLLSMNGRYIHQVPGLHGRRITAQIINQLPQMLVPFRKTPLEQLEITALWLLPTRLDGGWWALQTLTQWLISPNIQMVASCTDTVLCWWRVQGTYGYSNISLIMGLVPVARHGMETCQNGRRGLSTTVRQTHRQPLIYRLTPRSNGYYRTLFRT